MFDYLVLKVTHEECHDANRSIYQPIADASHSESLPFGPLFQVLKPGTVGVIKVNVFSWSMNCLYRKWPTQISVISQNYKIVTITKLFPSINKWEFRNNFYLKTNKQTNKQTTKPDNKKRTAFCCSVLKIMTRNIKTDSTERRHEKKMRTK